MATKTSRIPLNLNFLGETAFLEGIFCLEYPNIHVSQTADFHFANYRFSFRKLQIFISQTTDFHFANYTFPHRKLQISISQTTDFHFANYRFPFRKLQISISQTTDFHFVSQTTVSRWRSLVEKWRSLVGHRRQSNRAVHEPFLRKPCTRRKCERISSPRG